MAELFPETPREHYAKAPLVQVVCQLRFPKLLRIESQAPAEFQESIRKVYPLMRQDQAIPFGIPADLSAFLSQQIPQSSFQFVTEDQSYTAALSADSVSLTTERYTNWETFELHLVPILEALVSIYKPSFYSRLGLRYQDIIDRNSLGIKDLSWRELLRPELLAELVVPAFHDNLENVANRLLRVRNPDGSGSVLLRHGLAAPTPTGELPYLIDIDFFTEQKTETANAIDVVRHYNRLAGRAFRWCITEKLRLALQPEPMEPRT